VVKGTKGWKDREKKGIGPFGGNKGSQTEEVAAKPIKRRRRGHGPSKPIQGQKKSNLTWGGTYCKPRAIE